MKAELSQIPPESSQTAQAEPRPAGFKPALQAQAGAFAYVRRLERRIVELELNVSTLRRDLNRIDRTVYRDKSSQPSLMKEPAPAGAAIAINPLLFGN